MAMLAGIMRELLFPSVAMSAFYFRMLAIASGIVLVVYAQESIRSLRTVYQPGSNYPGLVGCLWQIAILKGVFALLLLVGVYFHIRIFILAVAAVTVLPALFLWPEMIWAKIAVWLKLRK
jgi:hypothetical protein